MSSDPLPVPESSATPREDADYEAVHAVLTATARGRKFLTEYVARRRRADPREPADIVAALEAGMREGLASQASPAFVRGLAELVAAIERIGAELSSDRNPAVDVHFAVERIQDIAIALRQHDVAAALCDGLDAAIREVGDAIVRSETAEARADNAAGQLRELARQIAGMTARAADAETAAQRLLPQAQAPSRSHDDPSDPVAPPLPVPSPLQGGDEASQTAASANATAPQRALSRDPLAALQALSEEELIALFS